MFIYSTCKDCGGLLHVTNNDIVHPGCIPPHTKVERLAEEWLAAVESDNEQREIELFTEIEKLDTRPPRILDAALRYASWGWPVFPLKPPEQARRHPEPVKAAKRPATRNGFKDATTDTDQITDWWTRHPDAGLGIPTGHAFDVIDIDTYSGDGGLETYQDIRNLDRAIHGQVATASGGVHLYITPTGNGNQVRWKPGTDYRGQGGYVVVPPTRLLNDRRLAYSWTHPPSPVLTGRGDTYGVA